MTTTHDAIGKSQVAWGPPLTMFKLVHYVAHTSIGKRVVGLLLKGLLVKQVGFALLPGENKALQFTTELQITRVAEVLRLRKRDS